jgi:hypothetical protein
MHTLIPLVLSGCIFSDLAYEPDLDEPIPTDLPYVDETRTGDCSALSANWSGQHGATIGCWDLVDLDRFAADRLSGLWIHQAAAVCAYDTTTYEVQGMMTACGPMSGPGAFACPSDGSIAYDRPFFASQYAQHGDFAVVTILAHEWGHINQGVTGISYDPSVPTIARELHADCQAGIFAAVEADAGLLAAGDAEEAFSSLCSAGDPEGTPWFHPSAHGTCAQRVDAFAWGFEEATARLEDVCGPNPLAVMREICG